MSDQTTKLFYSVPFCMDWITYDGEVCVGQFNWEESTKTGKAMIDLSVCMTQAFNQNIYATVEYDPKRFAKRDGGDGNG